MEASKAAVNSASNALSSLKVLPGPYGIVKTIAVFDDFCHANDPYEEHDFGAFEVDGHTVMFKIDYFDHDLSMHSPDPADPSVTQRVITIMLAEEY